MEKEIKKLWISALKNESRTAYRRLGKYYLKEDQQGQVLGKLCLQKAIELGDEESFFIYHTLFSKGRKVINDKDYEMFYQGWEQAVNAKEKKRLWRYLQLGTQKQKKTWKIPKN